MRSLWTITYVGSHTATTIKKLERLLGIKAFALQRERFIWNEEKIERAVFFVEHGEIEWNTLLVDLLRKTSRMALRWQVSGDAVSEFAAIVSKDNVNALFRQGLPSGLREVAWTVRADQIYGDRLLASGVAIPPW